MTRHIKADDFNDRLSLSLTKSASRKTGSTMDGMNGFDLAVYAGLAVAVVSGFGTGLVRSGVTILAYIVAMPIAVWVMSYVPPLDGDSHSPLMQNWGFFLGAFLFIGMALGKLARVTVDEAIGSEAGLLDRFGGAALGAVRVGLVATSVVLVFDQIVPADREPGFLKGSQLRPVFSAAGQKGFRSLPPEVAATIDRLKRNQHI
jgi:membrane protein required for colicin V production